MEHRGPSTVNSASRSCVGCVTSRGTSLEPRSSQTGSGTTRRRRNRAVASAKKADPDPDLRLTVCSSRLTSSITRGERLVAYQALRVFSNDPTILHTRSECMIRIHIVKFIGGVTHTSHRMLPVGALCYSYRRQYSGIMTLVGSICSKHR